MFKKHVMAALAVLVLLQIGAAAAGNRGWLVEANDKRSALAHAAARLARASTYSDPTVEAQAELQEQFADYKEYYSKQYATKQEEARAFSNFKANMARVHAVNADPDATHWASGNIFSDLDFETFKQRFLNTRLPKATSNNNRRLLTASEQREVEEQGFEVMPHDGESTLPVVRHRSLLALPTAVNWTKAGKVTPVKSQGACGSCWAFTSTAAIESAYLITYGFTYSNTPIDLSEQQVISCSTGSAGCKYGGVNDGIDYVAKFNQSLDSKWRFIGSTGTCDKAKLIAATKPGTVVQLASGNLRVMPKSYTALKEAVAKQPVATYIAADANFQNYKGGVFKPSTANNAINHGVLITGYDATARTWYIKNSWGTGWGEKGYIRIYMANDGMGVNGMYQYSFFPPLKFKQVFNSATLSAIRAHTMK